MKCKNTKCSLTVIRQGLFSHELFIYLRHYLLIGSSKRLPYYVLPGIFGFNNAKIMPTAWKFQAEFLIVLIYRFLLLINLFTKKRATIISISIW